MISETANIVLYKANLPVASRVIYIGRRRARSSLVVDVRLAPNPRFFLYIDKKKKKITALFSFPCLSILLPWVFASFLWFCFTATTVQAVLAAAIPTTRTRHESAKNDTRHALFYFIFDNNNNLFSRPGRFRVDRRITPETDITDITGIGVEKRGTRCKKTTNSVHDVSRMKNFKRKKKKLIN